MKKLVFLALVVGALAVLARFVAAQKAEWQNLTESEVRSKLDAKLPGRVPTEQRAEIAETIVSGMRERGMLREESPAGDPSGAETESV